MGHIARALQRMDPFFRDPFDPFEINSFFYPERAISRRNKQSLANIMQSLDDATNLIMRSNSTPNRRRREIVESSDKFEIFIDVPEGMEAKDITLELVRNDEVLHLSGIHKVEKDNIVSESRISRMFTLGKNTDPAKISAKLSDGVLVVTVPKVEVEEVKESRKIEIAEETVSKKEEEVVTEEEISDDQIADINTDKALDENIDDGELEIHED